MLAGWLLSMGAPAADSPPVGVSVGGGHPMGARASTTKASDVRTQRIERRGSRKPSNTFWSLLEARHIYWRLPRACAPRAWRRVLGPHTSGVRVRALLPETGRRGFFCAVLAVSPTVTMPLAVPSICAPHLCVLCAACWVLALRAHACDGAKWSGFRTP